MTKHRAPAVGFIVVVLLIDMIGFGIIIPVMPGLIQELTGGSVSLAAQYGGWMLAAYAITQFFCAPVIGGLSDRFGRRPVLLASLFGFGLDYLFLAFAPSIGGCGQRARSARPARARTGGSRFTASPRALRRTTTK